MLVSGIARLGSPAIVGIRFVPPCRKCTAFCNAAQFIVCVPHGSRNVTEKEGLLPTSTVRVRALRRTYGADGAEVSDEISVCTEYYPLASGEEVFQALDGRRDRHA